ncbi:GNAT family N-acetyltransferase [Roseomonas sp. GC11]|uniref:GNAT family N-acetyltransferase n=1 Tax=Roseomonas sp. GC11 TaxID=2950546 RepID=UPI00210E25F4|nr:GNAT family N-acetyltransferase [Roseomonas sp. GC11]MCQ4160548.1 GNAT family N-acetyltransferase [Roseomonas sp. GC11]
MAAGQRYGVELRGPLPADAADVAALLAQLGAPSSPPQAGARLEALARDPACGVLVATGWNGRVIGLVALHRTPSLLAERPEARITALVVDEAERGAGIGRLLVKAASQWARAAGCDRLELALPSGSTVASCFCAALGFTGNGESVSRPLRKRAAGGG